MNRKINYIIDIIRSKPTIFYQSFLDFHKIEGAVIDIGNNLHIFNRISDFDFIVKFGMAGSDKRQSVTNTMT